ncbi:MAG: glycoside hydrolase family 30 beta sandwich domain-containing protein [Bacteroidota bacterium]
MICVELSRPSGENGRMQFLARRALPPAKSTLACVAVLCCALLGVAAGCGRSAGTPRGGGAPATVTVDVNTTYQTMEGFGAAVAFYTNWFTQHPNRTEIADIVFRDLGLDILRTGNWSQNTSAAAFADSVALVRLARASVPEGLRLMMASWSPPAALKDNASTKNGGTLVRQDGGFAYQAFGQWWASALAAYAAEGVRPDYISIQNEPNFMASWETCRFGATETATRAGYGAALAAVQAQLQGLSPRPKLIGPETAGISGNVVENFLAGLDVSHLDGVAHHLYSGGEGSSPDSFQAAMAGVAAAAAGKPIFMTEYADDKADMVALAWLINNALTVEGVSAYLYWDLVWAPPAPGAPPGGLVTLENPFERSSWTTERGYIVRDNYHAFGHYARWVNNGWRRVAATSTLSGVRAVAFTSPDGERATLVLVNVDSMSHEARVVTGDFAFATSDIFRSSGTTERTEALGSLSADGGFLLPARSIATVTLTP